VPICLELETSMDPAALPIQQWWQPSLGRSTLWKKLCGQVMADDERKTCRHGSTCPMVRQLVTWCPLRV
jgi:hypothetical protein